MDVTVEEKGKEMELSELDLDAFEEECGKKGQGYVSQCQIELLQEEIIRTGAHESLGIDPDQQKGSKRKSLEEELRRGQKANKQRVAAVGVRLIEYSQYPMIKVAFYEFNKVCQ